MAVSLTGLARAFGALAAADAMTTPEGRVAHAMQTFPQYVGIEGRDVTA